jgi:hypothetical protein
MGREGAERIFKHSNIVQRDERTIRFREFFTT